MDTVCGDLLRVSLLWLSLLVRFTTYIALSGRQIVVDDVEFHIPR